jgi:hypothetical protein
MIDLKDYIETVFEAKQSSTSNAERLKQLEKWLKDKKYPDYVKTLNKMLQDPKSKVLLEDGFGGELGDINFDFQPKLIRAASLIPTQAEIDVEKSLKHPLTKPENIKKDFANKIVVNDTPIVTFRGNYVIDGHHRWSEVAMLNPDGKMLCFDYDAEISPVQMLKAVQGAIAAVLSKRDDSEELPQSNIKSQNIYDNEWSEEKISKWISDTITDECAEELMKYYPKMHSKDNVVKTLSDNVVSFKVNNPPVAQAQHRGDMPQPDKAGTKKGDKKSAEPTDKGSALNKLKDGNFDSDIL